MLVASIFFLVFCCDSRRKVGLTFGSVRFDSLDVVDNGWWIGGIGPGEGGATTAVPGIPGIFVFLSFFFSTFLCDFTR